jgi:protein O-GlcNAc transferase
MLFLGYCYGQLGDRDRALKYHQEAVREDPTNAEAQFNLAVSYHERNEVAEALSHVQQAVALAPDDAVSRCFLAQCLLDLERTEEAIPILHQLLRSDQHDEAHILLVGAELDQGKTENALRDARAEVEERPGSVAAWVALGMALRDAGDEAAAKAALEKGRELDPEDRWVRWELANEEG